MTVVLALAMGLRNATIRKLAVPDLTTTVLTMTLTGLAADVPHLRGPDPSFRRRLLAVACMLAGAVGGALLVIHASTGWALGVATTLLAAITARTLVQGPGAAASGGVRAPADPASATLAPPHMTGSTPAEAVAVEGADHGGAPNRRRPISPPTPMVRRSLAARSGHGGRPTLRARSSRWTVCSTIRVTR